MWMLRDYHAITSLLGAEFGGDLTRELADALRRCAPSWGVPITPRLLNAPDRDATVSAEQVECEFLALTYAIMLLQAIPAAQLRDSTDIFTTALNDEDYCQVLPEYPQYAVESLRLLTDGEFGNAGETTLKAVDLLTNHSPFVYFVETADFLARVSALIVGIVKFVVAEPDDPILSEGLVFMQVTETDDVETPHTMLPIGYIPPLQARSQSQPSMVQFAQGGQVPQSMGKASGALPVPYPT